MLNNQTMMVQFSYELYSQKIKTIPTKNSHSVLIG